MARAFLVLLRIRICQTILFSPYISMGKHAIIISNI